MPIYAYKCTACGHAADVLQKISEDPLTVCPSCGQSTYAKQLTAAGFQLKGSGWYVTDFRNNGSKPDTAKKDGGAETKTTPTTATPAATPAPAPAPAADSKPSTPATGSGQPEAAGGFRSRGHGARAAAHNRPGHNPGRADRAPC